MASDAIVDLPFYMRGNFAPVDRELTSHGLPVEGSLPPELDGLYVRNGPNPREGTPAHWFLGDGMLHGVRLESGRAAWYRNRWVRTRAFEEGAEWIDRDGNVDRSVAVANTHVVCHAGRIFALVENAFPTRIGPGLETLGTFDFEGSLHTAMTAHPKVCPRTGELHFFGYHFAPPFCTYHRADPAGRLVRSEEIPIAGPTMMHDFAITERHVIFLDLPVVFDGKEYSEGRFPYAWSDEYGARLGVLPRSGDGADLRWFEIEPCYVFHPLNAFDDGDRVVLDAARYPELWRAGAQRFDSAHLHRWTLDLASGGVGEQPLDDRPFEFPRLDERRTGLAHRYGYGVGGANVDQDPQTLVKYDLRDGGEQVHDFGPGRTPSEPVFVPAGPAAGEDEGWILAYVYDSARNGSDLVVLDATRLRAPPQAVVRLPQRVPFGFHGSWIPPSALGR